MATLDKMWKLLLINQFHDIIPGSSIHWVYEQTEKEHAECLATCAELKQTAAAQLFDKDKNAVTLVNTLSHDCAQPVLLPAGWKGGLVDADGKVVPVQRELDGTVVATAAIPPQGVVTLTRGGSETIAAKGKGLLLENSLVTYQFAKNGELLSAYDKEEKRDILAEGCHGNVLTLYEDRPANYDAWDIDIFYEEQILETAHGVSAESLGSGPVRQVLLFTLGIGESSITQKVSLAAGSKRLNFQTHVEWRERHRMLRVAFPVNVAADQACFEIQYGYARRNTHRNVSWDMARFEVAAHRYADLSDNQYGVAILNDCKYGHKIHENVLDLNLLRSPTEPDPDADQGAHDFTYSLLPHTGTLIDSGVIAEAARLNQPPAIFAGFRPRTHFVPVTVDGKGVSLEVLKKAEKENCHVIRLVETRGCRTSAEVSLLNPKAKLVETNLMEWTDEKALGGGTIRIPMKPFEIRTFKIK